jgi:hypothetical protein
MPILTAPATMGDSDAIDEMQISTMSAVGVVSNTHPERVRTAHTHDTSILFEEYLYYAELTRAEEMIAEGKLIAAREPSTWKTIVKDRFLTSRGDGEDRMRREGAVQSGSEKIKSKMPPVNGEANSGVITGVTPEDWKKASRALRTTSWGSIFYLITTDILGPFSTP